MGPTPLEDTQSPMHKETTNATDALGQTSPPPDVDSQINSNDSGPSEGSSPFRFLDLPAELRLRIYEYYLEGKECTVRIGCFPSKCDHLLPDDLCTGRYFFLPHPSLIALPRVNHQIRLEIAPLVFATVLRIYVRDHIGLINFARNVGDLGRKRIEVLHFFCIKNATFSSSKTCPYNEGLSKFSNLKKLDIQIYPGPHDFISPVEFVQVHGLRKLRAAKVDITFAVVPWHRQYAVTRAKARKWRDDLRKAIKRPIRGRRSIASPHSLIPGNTPT
ncbi:hypothetical protein BU16DRAFT_562258 [Lophium mytilinum]|uniref:F-box domain-containing protein n=1 Tax=Lophium mytilinum TaxID=390894 RepID=A0A6A6QR19_9PEZI|nr:hypothetical protein BU16DRAFT_562258 [Lophium mytilinum]